MENVWLASADYGDLTTEHHDPRIEIMRVHVFDEIGLLPAIHDIKAFTPQVAFEGLTGERTVGAATA